LKQPWAGISKRLRRYDFGVSQFETHPWAAIRKRLRRYDFGVSTVEINPGLELANAFGVMTSLFPRLKQRLGWD